MRCTSGRLQKGRCKFNKYENGIPSYFQYYSDTSKGGEPYMNYCPIAHKEIDFNNYNFNFYPGSCSNGIISFPGTEEVISQNSFCVISSVIPNGGNFNLNVERSVCYPMFCTETTLTIQIGKLYLTCPKYGGYVAISGIYGYYGDVECPEYNAICTGTVLCNSIKDCIEKKSLYKESTFYYSDYSNVYQDLDHIGTYLTKNPGENSEGGKCGMNCVFCNNENSCLKCRNDEDYAIGSKIIERNNKYYLFCDLIQNFPNDQFELDSGIYYPFDNIVVPTERPSEIIESTKNSNEGIEPKENPTEINGPTQIDINESSNEFNEFIDNTEKYNIIQSYKTIPASNKGRSYSQISVNVFTLNYILLYIL